MMLAKLASSMHKPRGFTVLHPQQLPGSIAAFNPSSLWGIGKKTEAVLVRLGIRTIGDLLNTDHSVVRSALGERVLALVRGIQGTPDDDPQPIKEESMGHEYTFGHDVMPGPLFWGVVGRLSDQVSRRLRLHQMQGSVVRTRLRWSDFETHTRQIAIRVDIHDPGTLRSIARSLLLKMIAPERRIRLVGVAAAGLFRDSSLSFDEQLFPVFRQRKRLTKAVDQVWNRYGEDSLIRASLLL
jgi:DNA polymerase-4